MDQQTRAALKQDKFVSTTTHGLEWAKDHRQSVIVNGSIVLGIVAVAVLSIVVYFNRSEAATVGFGAAMQTMQTPIEQTDQPVPPGMKTFPSSAVRAKAAEAQFLAVANKYSLTPAGKNALYFAGLAQMEAGENTQAEETLKKVSSVWNSDLASLGKFALAQLYRNTSRDADAVELYQELTKKPSTTIPAGLAQLQLADLYSSEGKTAEAKTIYATLKQNDAKGPAGAIAAEKLNPTPNLQMGQP